MIRRSLTWLWPFVLGMAGCNVFADLGDERVVANGGSGGSGGSGGGWAESPDCDPESDVVWLRTYGDFSYDEPGMIVPDGDGGYFLQGRFDGTVDLGSGPISTAGSNDFFLARLDDEGTAVWTHRYGSAGPDELGPWLTPHPDGFIICGTNATQLDFGGGPHATNDIDAYIALMNHQGDLIWEQWMEGPAEQRCWGGAAVDPVSGDVYAGLLFQGEVTVAGQTFIGEANGDAMVVRLDGTTGAIAAARHWGDTGQDQIKSLAVLPDGSVVVTGYSEGSIDLGLGVVPSEPGTDAVLARYNADLSPVWAHVFSSTGNMGGWGLEVSSTGDLLWSVTAEATFDIGLGPITSTSGSSAVARVSAATGLATDYIFLDGYTLPYWLAEASDGSVLAAGRYSYDISVGDVSKRSDGGDSGEGDPVLVKLSPNLDTVEWVQFAADTKHYESFTSLVMGEDDTVIVTGWFYDELDIEGCSLRTSDGLSDGMLMKRKL